MLVPDISYFNRLKNDVENALLTLFTNGLTRRLAEVDDVHYTVNLAGKGKWLVGVNYLSVPCEAEIQSIGAHLDRMGYDIDTVEILAYEDDPQEEGG